jgi:hypothetical protein
MHGSGNRGLRNPGANAAKVGVKNSDIGAAGPHLGRMSFGYETPAGQVMVMGRRALAIQWCFHYLARGIARQKLRHLMRRAGLIVDQPPKVAENAHMSTWR